jgi:NADH-quinone oxidoreductase subunit C
LPDATGLELIAHDLRDQVPGSVTDTEHRHGIATLVIDPQAVLPVLGWLRETPNQDYHFLASVHGCDYLPQEPRFGIHYELLNMERVERLHVKAVLADPGDGELPEIDSVVELFPTADFQEREI